MFDTFFEINNRAAVAWSSLSNQTPVAMIEKKLTLIGVGNRFRRDDAIGCVLGEHLHHAFLPMANFIETTGDGATILELLRDNQTVFVFDAVSSGAKPGTIFRFAAHEEPLPAKFFNYSTHAFSLAEAIELGRTMNILPERLFVYGVEGSDFSAGQGLTSQVEAVIENVCCSVLEDVESCRADSCAD